MKPEPPVWVMIRVRYTARSFTWSSKRHNNLYYRRLLMDKYIGFDIDDKKTVACVVQKGRKDKYAT
ncbi:MAG TPA: hypothetical protein VMY06_10035, partial [Sedimentisphaerales bacterium]|nr:hypothetical protein [Sedimentisphaerales bacterium]